MSLASIQNAVKTQERQQVLSLTSFFDCVSFEWCEQYLDEGITVGCQFFSKLFFSRILQSYHNFSPSKLPNRVLVKFQERKRAFLKGTRNYANLTLRWKVGPSKLLSTYLSKSRLSPMTLPLCSNEGTW